MKQIKELYQSIPALGKMGVLYVGIVIIMTLIIYCIKKIGKSCESS